MICKVCHLTTVHPINDVRIFHKECKSLSANGFDVTIISCGDTAFEDIKDDINRISLCIPVKNRLQRMIRSTKAVYKRALQENADIYHFHDPELLLVGKKLKKKKKKVIYDAHEFYRYVIYYKEYLPKAIRVILARSVFNIEKRVSRKLDAVITPTDEMQEVYKKFSRRCYAIKNFDFKPTKEQTLISNQMKDIDIVHVGIVSPARLQYMVDIIKEVKQKITGVSCYFLGIDKSAIAKMNILIQQEGLEGNIVLLPKIPFQDVRSFLIRSKIGLNYHPYQTRFLVAIPMKVFEYMKCGLAVVSSDLPPLREFIKDDYNGRLIKSNEICDFSEKIVSLLNDDRKLYDFGIINWQLINDKYNWEQETQKLIKLYKEVLYE